MVTHLDKASAMNGAGGREMEKGVNAGVRMGLKESVLLNSTEF